MRSGGCIASELRLIAHFGGFHDHHRPSGPTGPGDEALLISYLASDLLPR